MTNETRLRTALRTVLGHLILLRGTDSQDDIDQVVFKVARDALATAPTPSPFLARKLHVAIPGTWSIEFDGSNTMLLKDDTVTAVLSLPGLISDEVMARVAQIRFETCSAASRAGYAHAQNDIKKALGL